MNHTMAALCDVCPPRYYCVNKDHADPCPRGRYCTGNTGYNWESCPMGTYGPVEMLSAESQCTQCDGGYYCGETGASNMTGECYPGYYCQYGVDTPAPNNNTGFGGGCPEGHYCSRGTADPIGCAAGTYNELTHREACELCPAGYYCLANFTTHMSTPCPRGAYCPIGTESPYQYECPAGTYNNLTMADDEYDCLPCTRK